MRKRILIFSLAYLPHVGGAELALKELTDRIHQEDFVFDLITLRFAAAEPAFEKKGNITVYRVGPILLPFEVRKLFFSYIAARKARTLHAQEPYDAIWSLMANRAGIAAVFFKRRYQAIPFLLTLQEGDDVNHPLRRMGLLAPFLRKVWKEIFERANSVQAISSFLAQWARANGATGDVRVVPNGVSAEQFQQMDQKKRVEIRTRLGFTDQDVVAITTSRLVRKNALDDLISSYMFLPPHFKLMIVGSGVLEKKLKRLVAKKRLTSRIQFIGYVVHSELPAYLSTADIFARTPRSEGFGSSFIEAMAARLPVVATSVGGITDFLVDGENGVVARVGDHRDIAAKIQMLATDASLRQKVISNASCMVAKRYQWDVLSEEMKRVLSDLTKSAF